MRRHLRFARALSFSLVLTSQGMARELVPPLTVGDSAPPIAGGVWLRNGPVDAWKAGQVYVLEFWATWCAPCLAMMPKIQEMHDTLAPRGVTVVGIGVQSESAKLTYKEALARHPDLTYPVVVDVDGILNRSFLESTRSSGMPITLIIGPASRLAWVGYPSDDDFEPALAAILAGEQDLAAARATDLRRRESSDLIDKVAGLRKEERSIEACTVIERMIELDPERNGWMHAWRYEIALTDLRDRELAAQFIREFLSSEQSSLAGNNHAFSVRNFGEHSRVPEEYQDLELGLRLASRAVELAESPNCDFLRHLAWMQYRNEDLSGAVSSLETALPVCPEGDRDRIRRTIASLRESQAETDPGDSRD